MASQRKNRNRNRQMKSGEKNNVYEILQFVTKL